MYVGIHDTIVIPADSQWIRDQLGNSVVEYKEINGGHSTFYVSKDASYFQINAMKHISKYNPMLYR
jgi:hypothetical protein